MSAILRLLLVSARTFALVGFVVGGVAAAIDLLPRRHVLEFQPTAGAGASFLEKLSAIGMRASIEGLGYGALGLALALLAALLAAITPTRASFPRRFVAAFVLCCAAFRVWITDGAWFAGEILPFLPAQALLLTNLVGYGALVVVALACAAIARRMPWAPGETPAAVAIGVALGYLLGVDLALDQLRSGGGFTDPVNLGIGAVVFVASVAVGSLASRLLAPFVTKLERRLAEEPLVPRPLSWGLVGLLLLATAASAPAFDPSPDAPEPRYSQLSSNPTSGGPNVVLITIDTLRADHLGCYGYERDTSPFLDEIASEGTRFADPVSAASWTKPATGTILTGLYPSRHGGLYFGSRLQLPEGEQSLAEAYRRAGYATAGFVSNPNIKRVFEFDRGFDEYFDAPVEDTLTLACLRESSFGRVWSSLTRHAFNWKNANDVRAMNRHVFAWLDENKDERFFLYVHYIDPHEPYDPPDEYEAEWVADHDGPLGFPIHNERKKKIGLDLYDGEIRYTDDHLRELKAKLEEHGLWENTVFVVTSDHGEEWYEKDMLGHGFSLYQPVVQVPLIFHGPGIPSGHVVEAPVQIVDLAATLLDVSGVPASLPSADGDEDEPVEVAAAVEFGDGASFARAFQDPSWDESRPYFLETEFAIEQDKFRDFVFKGIREGDLKLVLTEASLYRPPTDPRFPAIEAYDLASDPGELQNVVEDDRYRDTIERLMGRLAEHTTFLEETGFRDMASGELSDAMRAEMEALGYGGGGH